MSEHDELMEDVFLPPIHEAFFQFGDEEPIRIAYVAGGEFSLVLKAEREENTEIEFSDGKGKSFKLFLKKSTEDGLQQALLQHGDAGELPQE